MTELKDRVTWLRAHAILNVESTTFIIRPITRYSNSSFTLLS